MNLNVKLAFDISKQIRKTRSFPLFLYGVLLARMIPGNVSNKSYCGYNIVQVALKLSVTNTDNRCWPLPVPRVPVEMQTDRQTDRKGGGSGGQAHRRPPCAMTRHAARSASVSGAGQQCA